MMCLKKPIIFFLQINKKTFLFSDTSGAKAARKSKVKDRAWKSLLCDTFITHRTISSLENAIWRYWRNSRTAFTMFKRTTLRNCSSLRLNFSPWKASAKRISTALTTIGKGISSTYPAQLVTVANTSANADDCKPNQILVKIIYIIKYVYLFYQKH